MKLLHLVVLSAALSFILLSSTSNGLQLQSYLKTTQQLNIRTTGISNSYRNGEHGIMIGSTNEYEQTTALQVAKDLDSNSLYVSTNPQYFDEETLQTTHFLPWRPNRGSFMQLNNIDFGEWFFTSQLSGCEIWIAHDRNPNTQPLIIHVNSRNCQKERHLGEREELGNAALTRYNTKYHRHYELLHRIMVNITKNPEVYTDPIGYLNSLHRRFPHLQISIYDQFAAFYGMYRQPYFCEDENAAYYGGWTFHLRDINRLQFYPMRGPGNSFARALCGWLRYLSGGYIGGRKKRQTQPTLCQYMTTTLTGHAQSGRLQLSDTGGILAGSVPNDQTLYISELFPASSGIGAPFNKLPIETLQYTCNSTELCITTRAIGTLTILPGILELSNVSISLKATLSPAGVQSFTITANWGIGNVNGHFTIEDNLETSQLLVRGSPQGTISLNFEDLIESLTGQRIPLPVSSVSFRDVAVFGAVDTFTSGSATFSISGKHGQNNVVHIVLQKSVSNSGAKYAGAFAAEITSFRFADLVQDLTGTDISGVPFLDSIVVPTMAVTASTADISSSSLLQVFEAGSLLQLSNGYIQGGVTAYFHLSTMNNAPLKMSYSKSRFSFEVLQGRSVSLSSLLSQVGVNFNSVPLPPGISDVLNLNIMHFSINTSSRELFIDVSFPNTMSYFGGLLKIRNVVVSVHAMLKAPRSISVEARGHLDIGNEMFDVYIRRDSRTNRYILSSQILELHVSDIIEEFEAAVFPDKLNDIIMSSGFFDFSIKNMGVSYSFGSQPLQIQMSGSPVINGYEGPYIYMIIIKQGGMTKLVQGFELGTTNLADLVKTVSGLDVRSITIFNQQLQAAILISPVTLPGVTLQGNQLSGFSINKGLSLQATMTWPPECSSDLMCNVAQTLLGENARLMLQGTITNTQSFSLMAGVSDIRLGSLFTLTRAGFGVMVFGPEIQIGIFGSLRISNPDITLNGAISVGTRGVVLELTMTGCWERAFGADWLTICSLQGLIALKPELAFLPGGLALGGQVKIGKPSCRQIQATGFIGIDADMPQENYYYVDVHDELTFGSVLELFCIDFSLPRPLAESGFPEGFMSSFSLLGKELPHVPLSIPLGYRLKGMFNILGLTATVDVNIGLPSGIKVVVLLPPLDLANGLLTIYASRDDSSKGPYLNASIGLLPPNVNIEVSGYVSVLGISVEVTLRISNTQYQLSIEGRMLGLFQASLEITASYGSIRSASFRVRGKFKSDLCNRVEGIVKNALQKSSEEATRAITDAQRVVNKKKAVLNDANRKLTEAQAKLDRRQRKFDNAVAALGRARADLRGVCTPPTCRSVCVAAPCGTTCAARVRGRCVSIRPKFSSCCFRGPNVICEGQRADCIALRETLSLALRGAEALVDRSRAVLDAATLALEVAKGAVNAAKIPFDAAVAALEAVKQTYRVGVKAANQIRRLGLGGIVNLKEISFDVSLSVANGGNFDGLVRGCLVGNNVELNININLHDVTAIARQIADHVIDGLSSVF